MQLSSQFLSSSYLFFALTGIVSGFLSGLLSIGGGFILVPMLLIIFAKFYHFEPHYALQLILGTTMACMIVNAIGATMFHNKKESIYWIYLKKNWPYIILGTIIGVVLTSYTPTAVIKIAFAIFCLYSGFRMLFKKHVEVTEVNDFEKTKIHTALIAGLCGLIGVGGANLVVPFLLKRGVEVRKALGTASAFQVPLSIVATISYIVMGLIKVSAINAAPGAVGYVFIPALLVISIFGVGFNKLGVMAAHGLPIEKLKKAFGLFTLIIGINMLYAIIIHGA